MDPGGQSEPITLQKGGKPRICPAAAVREYMSITPGRDGSLFIHADGSPLTTYQFVSFKTGTDAVGAFRT